MCFITYQVWSWFLHDFSSLWWLGNIEQYVIITGIHVRSMKHGALNQDHLSLMNFNDNIADKKWRAVIFREDIDWKLMANTVGAIKNPKYHKVLSRIAVVMMVVNNSSLNVRDCEHESFPSCQNSGRKCINNMLFSPEENPSTNMNVMKGERRRVHFN